MKTIYLALSLLLFTTTIKAQSAIGKWKKISHEFVYEGKQMDSHQALLKIRPCANKIFYEINANGTFRLNAATSGCDEQYGNIQEKLYKKSKWKIEGNKIFISATNFAVSTIYTVSFSGKKMIWKGTDGEGTITYQKL